MDGGGSFKKLNKTAKFRPAEKKSEKNRTLLGPPPPVFFVAFLPGFTPKNYKTIFFKFC